MVSNQIDGCVVFFDGECGLCDRFVQFLIRIDKKHNLRFATLQGETSRAAFGELSHDPENWSIKYIDEKGSYSLSTAALRALAAVGGGWNAARCLLIFPRIIRDSVYRFVATHRYRWFGKFESCMLPTPTLKERFLP